MPVETFTRKQFESALPVHKTTLSLELENISPGPDFIKMPSTIRPDGLPDGYHTGGVWLSPDESEVWKPLDGKCAGGTERYPTYEAECLTEMTGKPGFPANWRVEEQNGRHWLVRPKCLLWPQDKDRLMGHPPYRLVEDALFAMNEAGWEYNDLPQLAYDWLVTAEWCLLDFSIAHKPDKWQTNWHGDFDRVMKWYRLMGQDWIADLRQRGKHHVYHAIQLPEFCNAKEEPYNVLDAFYPLTKEQRREYVYIYASTNRPMSYLWARMDGVRYLGADTSKRGHVHTWVVCDHLLDQETVNRYELTFAYRPWP